jgi:hypothetical protein
MATKKTVGKVPAQDLKAIAAELGVPVKEGKITAARGRYYVSVGKTKKEIQAGEIIDAAQLKSLAGKPVAVVVSGRNIVAIGAANWRPPIIVCYVPVPEIIKGVRPELRATLVKAYADRKVITPQLQERLLAGK